MKKLAITVFAILATCGSAFAADFPINSKGLEYVAQNLKVVNICHLTDNELNRILACGYPDVAVEIPAQTSLPISLFLKGELVDFKEQSLGTLVVKQTFYARCLEEGLILSTNLTDWKPFSEFITGIASASIRVQEGQPFVVLGAEINQRA